MELLFHARTLHAHTHVRLFSLLMAVPTVRRALSLLLVASTAPDVEGVLLGAGHSGIVGRRVLAVTLEAALDIFLCFGFDLE